MIKISAALALLFFVAGAACADDEPLSYEANPESISLSGYVVFLNVEGPMSWVSANGRDIPRGAVPVGFVHTEVCEHGLSFPISANLGDLSAAVSGGWGRSGYDKAFAKLHKAYPGLQGIYDVAVDTHLMRILFVYTRFCTVVTGRGFR